MARHDWFRNSEWNPQTEELFFAKLARAKDKTQCIRIQACILARSHPHVALDLLEKYFAIGNRFHDAPAYCDQAEAYSALGDEDKAIEAYERALACEAENPNVQTQASLELPFLIASTQRRDRYPRALEILGRKDQLLFPVQFFQREAALALMAADLGDQDTARLHATRALEFAGTQTSGLPYHPGLGLVGSKYESTRAFLAALVAR